MDCLVKTVINSSYITNASVHSLRSLGQLYGRISLRSRAAPINLPSMRGVMSNYPPVENPSLVGTFEARAKAGGGYVWDAVLEYRVWCSSSNGAPDLYEGNDYY